MVDVARTGTLRLHPLQIVILFATVWSLFLVALSMAVGARVGGTIIGMVAIALPLFRLVQSRHLGSSAEEDFSSKRPLPP